MPFQKPTSVMFGGADLGTLYVTSMRFGLTDAALADSRWPAACCSSTSA